MGTMIEVKNVSIRYLLGDFHDLGLKEWVIQKVKKERKVESHWAVQNVSFTLESGDFMGILGANGAGKSTLLKSISGLLPPKEGTMQVNGNVTALLELGTGFDGDLNLRENIYMRGALLGYTKEFIEERVDDILAFAELEPFQYYKYKQLSSGMRSRLAFSIACMIDPEILILDEVLSVGDSSFRKKSSQKMLEIIQSGATTLFVSHSTTLMRKLCNKLLWLDGGKQIAFAEGKQACADLITRYEHYQKLRATDPTVKPDLRIPFSKIKPPLKSTAKSTAKPAAKSADNTDAAKAVEQMKKDYQIRERYFQESLTLQQEMIFNPAMTENLHTFLKKRNIKDVAIYGETVILKTLVPLLKQDGVTIDYMVESREKSNYAERVYPRSLQKYPHTQLIIIADLCYEKEISKKLWKLTKIPHTTIRDMMK